MLAYIDYTNWRGVRKVYLIMPLDFRYVENEYHPIRCAAIVALDMKVRIVKTFPISHIRTWTDVPGDINGEWL